MVESASLLRMCTRKGTESSNLSLSAIFPIYIDPLPFASGDRKFSLASQRRFSESKSDQGAPNHLNLNQPPMNRNEERSLSAK